MPRLTREKLGRNYAKETGSGKEANFYFPGLTTFFPDPLFPPIGRHKRDKAIILNYRKSRVER
jgi:hypothetical protein